MSALELTYLFYILFLDITYEFCFILPFTYDIAWNIVSNSPRRFKTIYILDQVVENCVYIAPLHPLRVEARQQLRKMAHKHISH